MSILLLQPPVHDFYASPKRMAPLALLALFRTLGQTGRSVRVHDLFRAKGKPLPLPAAFAYLAPFLQPDESPFSFFHRFKRFGRHSDALKVPVHESTSCVAITSLSPCYAGQAKDLAQTVKKQRPDLPVVVGGPGPSLAPDLYLTCPAIDQVVQGDNVEAISDLLASPGSTRLAQAGSSTTWRLVHSWLAGKRRFPLSLVVSRGCPRACSFCAVPATSGSRHRVCSLSECEDLFAGLPGKRLWVNFEDDNLSVNRPFFFALLKRIIHHGGKDRFNITFMNGLDYRDLDTDSLQLLHRAGLRVLNLTLGVVPAPGGHDPLRRGLDLDRLSAVIRTAGDLGIGVTVYWICGIPGVTLEQEKNTLAFLCNQPVRIGFSPFYSLPGTSAGLSHSRVNALLWRGSACYAHNTELTTCHTVTFFKLARLLNFVKFAPEKSLLDYGAAIRRMVREKRFHCLTQGTWRPYPSNKELFSSALPGILRCLRGRGFAD